MQRKLISTALLLQGFLYLMVCVLFPKPLFLLFWGLNVLRLADSFSESFWKVWTVSPEITHTSPSPTLPTSLTHTPLSFPSFLHSLLTHSLVHSNKCISLASNFTVLADFMEHPGWHTLTSGPQVEQSYWEPETQSPWDQILCLGCTGKCWNYLACPGETNFTCVISVITPPPSPACWQSGAPGAELSAHGVWLSRTPGSKRPGGAMTLAPRGRVGAI